MSEQPIYEKPEYGEGLFRAIAKQSGEGISLADTGGNYIFVNSAFCKMTGYSETELLEMNVRDLVPQNVEISLFPRVVKKCSGSRETELVQKDGSRFWAEIKGYPIELGGRNFVLGIVHDITEQKCAKEALLIEKKNLENALAKIKQLSGLLPICSKCKKIRDDRGYWDQIETYIQKHSEAEFSHSICPECAKELYPDLNLFKDWTK